MSSSTTSKRSSRQNGTSESSKLLLHDLAAQRLQGLRESKKSQRSDLPIEEWLTAIPQLKEKGYVAPTQLRPLLDELEKIQRGEEVRIVCHTPPRGGKSETLLASISWLLERHLDWELAYCSYNAQQARSKAYRARDWAKSMGIPITLDNLTEWRTKKGGGCIARGVGEGITGQGADVIFVDDPVKNRVEAESPVIRERTWNWFNEAVYTRGNPSSAKRPKPRSIIVNMARWHTDDLAGRLIKQGWKYICLPALTEVLGTNGQPTGEERSFWPEYWPASVLAQTRKQLGPYSFASLYQGAPRPRGGAVFEDVWIYDEMPSRITYGIGIDLAYSKKTASDWSVAVVMAKAEFPERQDDGNIKRVGYYYVVDVIRRQVKAPEFTATLKFLLATYPGARMRWYGSGIETEGVASFMRPKLPRLEALSATADKFIRAQRYAAQWNDGKVLLPGDERDWLDQFIDEHRDFTGINDISDDVIDASVAAFDILEHQQVKTAETKPFEAPRRW